MFFKIIKFFFFVSREGNGSSELSSYFSQGSTSKKEIDSWGTTHFGNCDPVSDTAGISISGLQLSAKRGCNVKTFLHKADGEKGETNGNWHQSQLPWEEWECSLSVASTKRCRSEVNIHLKLQQVTWSCVQDSLTEQCFPEIVKDQISGFFFSVLIKRLV